MTKSKQPLRNWLGKKAFGAAKAVGGLTVQIVDETLYAGLNSIPGNDPLKSNSEMARELDEYKRLIGRK